MIPNVILGSGMNPFADMAPCTYQDSSGPDVKPSVLVIQLPMCIDAERYREVIRDRNVLKDIITKAAMRKGFESGVVTLRWSNDNFATSQVSVFSSGVLKNKEIFQDRKHIEAMVFGKETQHQIMYEELDCCTHSGQEQRMYKTSDSRYLLKPHYQVTKELELACNAPIVGYRHGGDAINYFNHPYGKYVDPRLLLTDQLAEVMYNIEKNPNLSDSERIAKIKRLVIEQSTFRNIPLPDLQILNYVLPIRRLLPYYLGVMMRRKRLKISSTGTLKAILHIMGNHCKNSYKDKEFFVSDVLWISELLKKFAYRYIIEQMRAGSKEYDVLNLDDIEKEFAAPQVGYLGEADGTFGVQGYPYYAMNFKHKKGDMNATQDRAQRRVISHLQVSKELIDLSGDKHKVGIRVLRGMILVRTGGQQAQGIFGREIDGSEQDVFSVVYGVPVGGFNSGPTVYIFYDQETIRRYAEKPFPIDSEKLFENALK